jgi:hypothetical protein
MIVLLKALTYCVCFGNKSSQIENSKSPPAIPSPYLGKITPTKLILSQ